MGSHECVEIAMGDVFINKIDVRHCEVKGRIWYIEKRLEFRIRGSEVEGSRYDGFIHALRADRGPHSALLFAK